MKLCSTLILLILCAAQVRAATYGVTVPAQNTLTNGMLPSATSGRQLASTAIQQSGLTNLLVPGYVTLGNTTNRISDDGSNLTRNGVAISGGGSGDVVGPASAFDNAIVRFDGVTGKLVQNSLTTISDAGAFTFSPGVRQTFNPDANTPGFNVGSVAGDPSTPINGDLWYDSMLERLRAQINGSTVSLGAGGSGGDTLWNNVANTATLTNTMQSMTFFHDVAAGDDLDINFDMYAVMNSATFNDWGNIYMVVSTNNAQLNVLTTANNTDSGVRIISGDSLFEILGIVDGANEFRVVSPSGYTGAGTLFLSDDGTYKAAGGGSAIWVNDSGTIQPASGQTTNRLSFTSGAPDNATNVAFQAGTASLWNNSGALLAALRNAGTNNFIVTHSGGIMIGPNALDWNGALPENGESLISFRNVTAGDPDVNEIIIGVMDTGPANYTYSDTFINLTNGIIDLVTFDDASTISTHVTSETGVGRLRHRLLTGGTARVSFDPYTVSTGSAIAHFVDTINAQTNGDSLFKIRNAGSERITAQHDGTLSIQNTTNRIGDNGSAITYNGIVIGGSSSVITYTNQFVFNSKVTYNADVYVTNATIYINNVDVRTVSYGGACSDETTTLTTGTNKLRFRMPHAMTLTSVRANLTTAQTAGSILTVDINEGGTSVLSTKLTIDDNETTSTTAATPAVISDSALADDGIITIDIDQVGTSPAGLKIWLTGLRLP